MMKILVAAERDLSCDLDKDPRGFHGEAEPSCRSQRDTKVQDAVSRRGGRVEGCRGQLRIRFFRIVKI